MTHAYAIPSDVGGRIRFHRRARGLSLDEVARGTDIDVSALSRMERGFRDVSADKLERIAAFLGLRVGDLRSPKSRPRDRGTDPAGGSR